MTGRREEFLAQGYAGEEKEKKKNFSRKGRRDALRKKKKRKEKRFSRRGRRGRREEGLFEENFFSSLSVTQRSLREEKKKRVLRAGDAGDAEKRDYLEGKSLVFDLFLPSA